MLDILKGRYVCHLWNFFWIAAVSLILLQAGMVGYYTFQGRTSYRSIPFQRNNPTADLRILFVGDSTARGTGALDNTESVAGWFGRDYPQAHIVNYGENGKKLRNLKKDFPLPQGTLYDVVVVQIGGNDILRFTPLSWIKRDLSVVLDQAKSAGKHVIILHCGNVGTAPMFIWPMNWIYEHYTEKVRSIYQNMAQQKNVIYVDLFQERAEDIFLKDPAYYYSPDSLHPSGHGYRWWYEQIQKEIQQARISLPKI